jgi:hypothetical protein
MATLYPKDIIHNVLIKEMQDIVIRHPYLAFALICSGIEFLGKCIDTKVQRWDSLLNEHDEPPFDKAIKELFPAKYKILLDKYKLRDQLRNGLTHFLAPKSQIGLTQLSHDKLGEIKNENHPIDRGDKVVFVIEYFYMDFVEACKKVISKDFESDKMNKPFLSVPD